MESLLQTLTSGKEELTTLTSTYLLCSLHSLVVIVVIMEDTLLYLLHLSLCVGHLGLYYGRFPLWQSSPTRVFRTSRCSALSWREGCWRNHRTALTCCKRQTHTCTIPQSRTSADCQQQCALILSSACLPCLLVLG